MITNTQSILLDLLAHVLNRRSDTTETDELPHLGHPDRLQWLELISLAEKMEVNGLLYDAVSTISQDQRPDAEVMMRWTADIVSMERDNLSYRAGLYPILEKLGPGNPYPIVMKGIVLGSLYPNPKHRTVGDVDLFVPLDHQPKCLKLFQDEGAEIDPVCDLKHTALKCNGLNWELHFHCLHFYSRRTEKRFLLMEAEETAPDTVCHETVDGHDISVFPPLFRLVYLTAHLQHHLLMERITLRQVVEWMLALHHERTPLGIKEVAFIRQLKQLGLFRLYRALGYIAVTHLGLTANSYAGLSDLTKKDARHGDYLLQVILDGHIPGGRQYKPRLTTDDWRARLEHNTELVKRCIALRSICPEECLATPFGFAIQAIRRRLAER